jgi:hypothetical protein
VVRRAVPVLIGVLLLAGCGGGGGGKSSTKSAADWASAYCSAASTWVTAFQSARSGLKSNGGPNVASAVDTAVSQVSAATNTFTLALGKLGKPDTPDGATSQATAKQLGNVVQGHVARASAATQTNNPDVTDAQRATVVKTQATQSIAAVADTTTKLAADDPALGTAMKSSSECQTLNADLAKG